MSPPLLQFLVQRQNAVLEKLANCEGLSISLDSSKNYPTVESVDDQTEEELDKKVELFAQSVTCICKTYDYEILVIEDDVWPYIQKEFYEQAKSAFKDGRLQVFKKCKNTYYVVGLVGEVRDIMPISKQYIATGIKNKELFKVLEIKKILDSRFKQVKVTVHDNLLLLYGEGEVVKECAKHYEELSKTENMHFAVRVISENVCKFLKRKKIRQEINSCLLEKGFHVYWSVEIEKDKCYLDCRCIFGMPEREADFITSYLIKEIEFEERYLQIGQVKQQISEWKNATLFSSENGLSTIVYYGNIKMWEETKTEEAQQKLCFSQTIPSSEILALLGRFNVQTLINSNLQIPADIWSISLKEKKIKANCQNLAEVDHLFSSILNQVWQVSRPEEICHNDLVGNFCKDHSDFVEMKRCKKYFTIFVTVDLKDELEKLFNKQSKKNTDEGSKDFERDFKNLTERLTLFLKPEIREYLTKRCDAEMTKIQENFKVCLSFKEANLEFRAISKDNVLRAKQDVLHLLEGISSQTAVVRIRRDCTYELVKEEMDKLTRKSSCIVTPEEKKDEEPNYLDCWVAKNIRIVSAEGSLESTMCDVLLCFLDENLQPVRRSAKKIFMTGISVYI